MTLQYFNAFNEARAVQLISSFPAVLGEICVQTFRTKDILKIKQAKHIPHTVISICLRNNLIVKLLRVGV